MGTWLDVWAVVGIATIVLVDCLLVARVIRAAPGVRRRLLPLVAVFVVLWTFVFVYTSLVTLGVEPEAEWALYPFTRSTASRHSRRRRALRRFGEAGRRRRPRCRAGQGRRGRRTGEAGPGSRRPVGGRGALVGRAGGLAGRERARGPDSGRRLTRRELRRGRARGRDPRSRSPRPAAAGRGGGLGGPARARERPAAGAAPRADGGCARVTRPPGRGRRSRAAAAATRSSQQGRAASSASSKPGSRRSPAGSTTPASRCSRRSRAELTVALAELDELGTRDPPDRARGGRAGRRAADACGADAGPGRRPLMPERLPEPVETAAYFLVAEALANVARYSRATRASVEVRSDPGSHGSRSATTGSAAPTRTAAPGLRGLSDRVSALGGKLRVSSPPGGGPPSSRRSRVLPDLRDPPAGAPGEAHRR